MNCPNCTIELSERGIFCKGCAQQVRCTKCRDVLEPGAVACVECGALIGQTVEAANGTHNGANAPVIAANRNTLSYSEDRNTRKFEASLTDSAMNGLGDVFGELFAHRGIGRISSQVGTRTAQHEVIIDDQQQLAPPPSPPPAQQQEAAATTKNEPHSDRERVLKIFSPKGETLELIDNRLKAKNGADYLRRLTYLFLYAHECHGRPSATEHDLKVVLRTNKAWDASGNANRWVNKRVGISSEGDDRVKLNATGREEAQKALVAICDANIPDEWNPDKASATARKPRKKKA